MKSIRAKFALVAAVMFLVTAASGWITSWGNGALTEALELNTISGERPA